MNFGPLAAEIGRHPN